MSVWSSYIPGVLFLIVSAALITSALFLITLWFELIFSNHLNDLFKKTRMELAETIKGINLKMKFVRVVVIVISITCLILLILRVRIHSFFLQIHLFFLFISRI